MNYNMAIAITFNKDKEHTVVSFLFCFRNRKFVDFGWGEPGG